MTKNRLANLNDHLFAQLERLANEEMTSEQIDMEVRRSDAVVAIADQILRHATLQVQAAKIMSDHGNDPTKHLPQVEVNALYPTTKMLNGNGTKQ